MRRGVWLILGMGIGLALVVAACGGSDAALTETPRAGVRVRTLTPAPPPTATGTPSPTPRPVAAQVGDQVILVDEWVAETQRALRAAQELHLPLAAAEAGEQALNMLIERLLLAEAARERGLFPTPEEVEERLATLQQVRGGAEAWAAYLAQQGYTETDFRQALALDMAAARMRDAIADQVPAHGPQVKARVIQVPTRADAEAVLQYLQAGNEFRVLARQYHPGGQGDLGWFPRGVLWAPEVEDAAFALEPGQYSDVIATERGFYIVYVEDRADDRPYAPWARRRLQTQALAAFLEQQRQRTPVHLWVTPQQPPLPAEGP